MSRPTTTSLNGKYPLGRLLYIYVAKEPNKPLPTVVKEFLTLRPLQGRSGNRGQGWLPAADRRGGRQAARPAQVDPAGAAELQHPQRGPVQVVAGPRFCAIPGSSSHERTISHAAPDATTHRPLGHHHRRHPGHLQRRLHPGADRQRHPAALPDARPRSRTPSSPFPGDIKAGESPGPRDRRVPGKRRSASMRRRPLSLLRNRSAAQSSTATRYPAAGGEGHGCCASNEYRQSAVRIPLGRWQPDRRESRTFARSPISTTATGRILQRHQPGGLRHFPPPVPSGMRSLAGPGRQNDGRTSRRPAGRRPPDGHRN